MARNFAKAFYSSSKWQKVRATYLAENPYCERCLARGKVTPAEHVHHKRYIDTPAKVNNPMLALNPENLEALCEPCHSQEHNAKPETESGLYFDSEGNLIAGG